MNTLTVQNVVKRYASHTALDDVSLSIPKNSIFGLLGPNGAGKTSLIRIINQITGPDSGTLFFENEPLTQKHIQQIGYLPEERGLYKKMEVGEQALYLAQLKGMKKAEAKKKLKYWFEKFEIDAWWNKKIEELSKGMQQKVQFVATVIHNPSFLILDEPFSGFDPVNADLVKNQILELKKNGTTIVLSTHSMASVEELCDNIAMIHRGRCVLDGRVGEIREQYKTGEYEIVFTGNMIAFTAALWAGGTIISQTDLGQGMWKVRIRLSRNANVNGLLNELIHKVEIKSLHEYLPGMHEIFVNLVKGGSPETVSAGFTE